MSLKEFLNKIINLKIEIDKSNDFKNLLSGPFYPFFIPKLDIEDIDIGRTFKEFFLPAVKKSMKPPNNLLTILMTKLLVIFM